MFALLCVMAAVIMLLAFIVVRVVYRNSDLRDMVSELSERPCLDGLSEHSTRLILGYIQARRLHDGFRHETEKRAKTKPYQGQWE